MLTKLLLATSMTLATQAFAAETTPPVPPVQPAGPTADCQTQPGAAICSQLDDLLVDYTTSCTGDPCSQLWYTQANDDLALVQLLQTTLVPSTPIGADLAQKAREVATDICATERTSVDQYGYMVVNAENKLLPHLADLQTRAGYQEPVTCTISIQ